MRVAEFTTFNANRKEPLATLVARLIEAVDAAGMAGRHIAAAFSDTPVAGSVSAVARALKKMPELAPFATEDPPRVLTNMEGGPKPGETIPDATILSLAACVPRSLPFNQISLSITGDGFGLGFAVAHMGNIPPGITIGDSWGAHGRSRTLQSLYVFEADPAATVLPDLPTNLAAIFAACGKVDFKTQMVVPGTDMPAAPGDPDAVVARWRARIPEIAAGMPHDLPDAGAAFDARRNARRAGAWSDVGPMKPALTRAFKLLGYGCKGGPGYFELTRRTPANTTLLLYVDVGTWSQKTHAHLDIMALAGKTRLILPVTPREGGPMQYPIAGPQEWKQIVANLAHMVVALEKGLLPEFEAAAGPSPAWYLP
jgi:hypothetical protein